ncbi:GntR family transcriptional regulator [Caballeronia cordobensis]|uniref:GntR family transcriptional regulator n=1 Tax=Caballeronia cordobensis TaxID=1353886 RepID=UPI00045F03C7|nr:transcription regulator family protein [Burkholderia sp. RPE67]
MSKDTETDIQGVKETGTARVYVTLRNEILTMKLAPGTHLDEAGVAERFGVSRSPVREALVRLSAEGLVTILPNRGNIVAPMDFGRMPEFLDALDLLQRVTTRLAALHRTEEDLQAIRQAAKIYEKAAAASIKKRNSLDVIETNYEFHMTVARAGRNAYFAEIYRRLLEEGRRMLNLHFQFQTLANMSSEQMASDHTDMVAAIEAGDADWAEATAHQHAVQFKGRFMQFLDRNLTAQMPVTYSEGKPATTSASQATAPSRLRGNKRAIK